MELAWRKPQSHHPTSRVVLGQRARFWPKCISHWSRGNTRTLSHPRPAPWACYDGVSHPTRGRQCGPYGSNREDLVKMVQPLCTHTHTHTPPRPPHQPLFHRGWQTRWIRKQSAASFFWGHTEGAAPRLPNRTHTEVLIPQKGWITGAKRQQQTEPNTSAISWLHKDLPRK